MEKNIQIHESNCLCENCKRERIMKDIENDLKNNKITKRMSDLKKEVFIKKSIDNLDFSVFSSDIKKRLLAEKSDQIPPCYKPNQNQQNDDNYNEPQIIRTVYYYDQVFLKNAINYAMCFVALIFCYLVINFFNNGYYLRGFGKLTIEMILCLWVFAILCAFLGKI